MSKTYDDYTSNYCSEIDEIIETLEFGNMMEAIYMLVALKRQIQSDAG